MVSRKVVNRKSSRRSTTRRKSSRRSTTRRSTTRRSTTRRKSSRRKSSRRSTTRRIGGGKSAPTILYADNSGKVRSHLFDNIPKRRPTTRGNDTISIDPIERRNRAISKRKRSRQLFRDIIDKDIIEPMRHDRDIRSRHRRNMNIWDAYRKGWTEKPIRVPIDEDQVPLSLKTDDRFTDWLKAPLGNAKFVPGDFIPPHERDPLLGKKSVVKPLINLGRDAVNATTDLAYSTLQGLGDLIQENTKLLRVVKDTLDERGEGE